MESPSRDLLRPLLETNNDETEESTTAAILQEWNASVSAFVAENGGEDNADCYCSSVEPSEDPSSIGVEDNDDDEALPPELASNDWATWLSKALVASLLPDAAPTLGSYEVVSDNDDEVYEEDATIEGSHGGISSSPRRQPRNLVEGPGVIKFVKLAILTFGSIALVRKAVVDAGIDDRDQILTVRQIFLYEGGSILRDLVVFFVVGRMDLRTGVDTLEWVCFGLLANLYFESQPLIPWMQHSATPYEMHCLWPWQLWVFAGFVVAATVCLLVAHAVVFHQRGRLWIASGELLVCVGVFVLPVLASPYAHFHHWFAGWLLGMHANLHHKWWSRAAMAYCWGMYVNGIAVYGRDPLLTCDYARFLLRDQNCPVETADGAAMSPDEDSGGMVPLLGELLWRLVYSLDDDETPDLPDWRNCSSSGYHP